MSTTVLRTSCKCDVCSAKISSPNGYVLTTKQVLLSRKYWEKNCSLSVKRNHLPPTPQILFRLVVQLAGQSSGWIICEQCSGMFSFKRQTAKNMVLTWWAGGILADFGSLCSVSMNGQELIYTDKSAFDTAYLYAREVMMKYALFELQQFIATHKPVSDDLLTGLANLDRLVDFGVDVRSNAW